MDKYTCWLQNSLQRVFPSTPVGYTRSLDLTCVRNERVAFQACVRNNLPAKGEVNLGISGEGDCQVRVRRVGYVPMAHHNTETEADELDGVGHIPGYVPDPLFPEQTISMGPFESHAFWITVSVPADAKPVKHELEVTLLSKGDIVGRLTVRLDVRGLVLQPRRDFPVTHWFYADALCDWYKVEPFDEPFWPIAQDYMTNLVQHGSDCQYVPLFTPPTDGVKRPTQLLKVSTPMHGEYWFNFDNVKRWTRLASQCGARYFEWTHLFTQWGVKNAIRVYRNNANPESLLWPPETGATSEVYRDFLTAFLPEFHKFLQEEDLLDKSFFHLSDEPSEEHYENYRSARAMLKDLAPWMKVSDALSDVRYGREGLTDIPIPIISSARDYAKADIPAWVYWCCGPRGRYVQRQMDTPLAKIRMAGWLFYRLKARGFLHWGYNYWYKSQTQEMIDPFTEQAGGWWPTWSYGDDYVVYPGPYGPLDSIRWEVFAESLQDYALLQTLGISPDDTVLADWRDYDDFPKKEGWVRLLRQRLLLTIS